MKFFEGLHIDNHPGDQPENSYRDAKNMVIYRRQGAVTNELGTEQVDALPVGYKPIGKIVLPNNQVVVFLSGAGGASEIGILKGSTYETILNTPDLNFSPDYPIVGTYRISKGEKISDDLPTITDAVVNAILVDDSFQIDITEGPGSVTMGNLLGELHAEGSTLVGGSITVGVLEGWAHAEGTTGVSGSVTVGELNGSAHAEGEADIKQSVNVAPLSSTAHAEGSTTITGSSLAAPKNLSACNLFNFSASINWDGVPNAVSYQLERAENIVGPWAVIYNDIATNYGDTLPASNPTKTYYYRVSAIDTFGNAGQQSLNISLQFNNLSSC